MPKRPTPEERDARRAKNEAVLAEKRAKDRAEKVELIAGIIASRDNVPWDRQASGWPEALAETIIDRLWEQKWFLIHFAPDTAPIEGRKEAVADGD